MYTERNVAISGIHTHSGPGGYLQYVLYDITSMGFVKQSWEAVVSGIVEVPCAVSCYHVVWQHSTADHHRAQCGTGSAALAWHSMAWHSMA